MGGLMEAARGSTGGRRPRLGETEVRDRMLRAGVAQVTRAGLTVSLAHLSYEDVIREAEVPRSTGYRAWSSKEAFFDDLLVELAGEAWAGTAAFGPDMMDLGLQVLIAHIDELGSAAGRRAAWIDVARVTGRANFESMARRQEWRTYVALQATLLSLPGGGVRERVEEALRRSQDSFNRRISDQYEFFARVVGIRVRPEVEQVDESIGVLTAAIVEGLVLRRSVSPVVGSRFRCDSFGPGLEWTPAGLAVTALIDALTEADPDFDDATVPALQAELREAAGRRPPT
jgi:AcrR family transcriptional regulator